MGKRPNKTPFYNLVIFYFINLSEKSFIVRIINISILQYLHYKKEKFMHSML